MNRRVLPVLLILLVVASFVFGVVQIFDMRFAQGDVYPPYSTLRSDPLGARIVYESLDRVANINVIRDEDNIREFDVRPNAAFFYIGTDTFMLTEAELIDLEKFIKDGGRLVLTFYPQDRESSLARLVNPTPSPSPKASPTPKAKDAEKTAQKFFYLRDMARRWEFGISLEKKLESKSAAAQIPDIDAAIPWHSLAAFEKVGAAWRNVYAVQDHPVVIERSLGRGTIVLATDSYFLSNEAMQRDRRSAFVSWLVGDKREIVFDEVHHGISETAGVSTLIRRYRLGGFAIAGLILTVLICWKNVVRLVPASASRSEDDEFVSGKESFAGLTSLFRRNVSPSGLAETCYAEWDKSLPRAARSVQVASDRVRLKMEECRKENLTHRNPVEVYRQISEVISENKWKRSI